MPLLGISIEISDEEVVTYLKKFQPEQYQAEANRALQVGVAVLNKISLNNDLHYLDAQVARTMQVVEQQFQELTTSFQDNLLHALDPHQEGSYLSAANASIADRTGVMVDSVNAVIRTTQEMLQQQLRLLEEEYTKIDLKLNPANNNGYLGVIHNRISAFESNLNKQFNETDSASFVGKLRSCVNSYFGDNGEVLRILDSRLQLDLEGRTPLGQLFLGLKTEISLLRDSLVALLAKQELLNETTKKGFVFEDIVMEKLEEIAKPHADIVEDISLKVEAISNSKKGDFLYQFGSSGIRVVLDAKNYGKLKSLPAMLAYIKEAIKERSAQFGIIVAPDASSLQKQIGSWNVYNNCIVTCLDFLDVSIKYAKYYTEITSTDSASLNVGNVKVRLDEIGRRLKDFTVTKTKLTKLANGVTTSVQEIQALLDETRDRIHQLLGEIEHEFKKSEPGRPSLGNI